ncbi:hypothetical protein L596_023684 [Steinernema carpocapsae]|uniref:Uncharacterized protein n=1 Tax=Steinernema carpocapsae TaxID=34508 RepID=A0A4V5ZZH8_STECR|nr:hypothetical protein L596_023684 [Steinernema carpocapsae]
MAHCRQKAANPEASRLSVHLNRRVAARSPVITSSLRRSQPAASNNNRVLQNYVINREDVWNEGAGETEVDKLGRFSRGLFKDSEEEPSGQGKVATVVEETRTAAETINYECFQFMRNSAFVEGFGFVVGFQEMREVEGGRFKRDRFRMDEQNLPQTAVARSILEKSDQKCKVQKWEEEASSTCVGLENWFLKVLRVWKGKD